MSPLAESILSPADTSSSKYSHRMDLQCDAVRLCIALQGELNSAFLGACIELLFWIAKLPPTQFRRHSRKIIRLIESARNTLEDSGISLYMFTASPQNGKWKAFKDVYFDLLRKLQARRADVDGALDARTNSLLIRLSSNFSGCESSAPLPAVFSVPEKLRLSLAQGITICTPQSCNSATAVAHIAMSPPDAFPPGATQISRCFKRRRQRVSFLVPELTARARKRAKDCDERENEVPCGESSRVAYAYRAPPLTKRFGIFCTSKNSMHPQRPRSVRV
ncbi:hypothetical protein C8R45DRAFT_1025980 [Mycena sanguinolenta]|nr:hypothetical protein C8R45DRAFT_1025980 [Mycena sanguinolenta]